MDSASDQSYPLDREWDQIEPPINAFESAWMRGERPSITKYAPRSGPYRRLILVELVHADLEFRLKAGEPTRVESYFEEYPELAADPDLKLELIRAEQTIRDRSKAPPPVKHYLERFPEYASELKPVVPSLPPLSSIPAPVGGSISTADYLVLSLPRSLGKYELRQRVGMGGFGIVFRAWDTILLREVAIKIPRPEVAASPSDVIAFLREARNAIDLRHPNIVAIHDAGPIDGTVCLVSEFVEGITLAERIRVGPLGVLESATLMATVVKALGHAHRKGIIHRDLKPSNILLDREGKPHLTDFGLAKRSSGDSTLSPAGASQVFIGTPAYMPPEQARGDSASVDARSDVYSAGVLLYELLTGSVPFRGRGRLLQIQIEQTEPPPPRELNEEIPLDLETICLRALAKNRDDRYPSAGSMANDLTNFVSGRPVGPRPTAPRSPLDHRRRRILVGWGIFGAMSLVVLTGLALRSGTLEQQQAHDARLIEQVVRDTLDLASSPTSTKSALSVENSELADAIWDRLQAWGDSLAQRQNLAPLRADLLIRLAERAEAVGSDPKARIAWEKAIASVEPLARKQLAPWTRRIELARGLAKLGHLENNAGQSGAAGRHFEQSASIWTKLVELHRDESVNELGSAPSLLRLAEAILEGDCAARNAHSTGSAPERALGDAEQVVNQLLETHNLAADDLLKLARIERTLAERYQSINKPRWAAFWARRAIRSVEGAAGDKSITSKLAIERCRASLLLGFVEADATDFGFEGRAVVSLKKCSEELASAVTLDPTNLRLKRDLISADMALGSTLARSGLEDRALLCFRQAVALNKEVRRRRPMAHLDLDGSASIRFSLARLEAKRGRPWSAFASMTVAVVHEQRAVGLAPGVSNYRQARRRYLEGWLGLILR